MAKFVKDVGRAACTGNSREVRAPGRTHVEVLLPDGSTVKTSTRWLHRRVSRGAASSRMVRSRRVAAGCAANSAPPALQLWGSDPVRIYDPPEPPVSRDVVALHLVRPLVRVEVERMPVVGDLGRAVPPLRRPQQS
jgi:hypothetical protein